MKKLFILLLFVIIGQVSFGQVYQLMPQYGYEAKRMSFDSTLQIPTICGVPTLKSVYNTKRGAIAFDSCNNRFYTYNPKTATWSYLGSGGGSQTFEQVLSTGNLITQNDTILFNTFTQLNFVGKTISSKYDLLKLSNGNGGGSIDSYLPNGSNIHFDNQSFSVNNPLIEFYTPNFKLYNTQLDFSDGNFKSSLIAQSSIDFIDRLHYLPQTNQTTDTLATLDDIRSSGSSIDTTSLSNRINNRIDSIKRSTDSIFARKNGTWVFQFKDSIGGGSGFVPYTGATQDVDLGTHILNAQSIAVKGTNGNGHLDLRHQASDASATGQTTALFADANGDLKWKNDGNYYSTLKTQQTANRIYTYQNKSYTLGDSADISARVKYTDTATMLTPYQRSITAVKYSDTATMLSTYQRSITAMKYTDTASLSNRINLKLNISDTSAFDRKQSAAFTFRANNTSSTANMTDQVFRDSGTLTYSGTITWTGTTAPSGATSHRYRWCQIGKQVTLTMSINYASAGSALTALKLTLPVGCPSPTNFGTLTAANDVLGSAWAFLGISTSNATTARVTLNNNASNNGFEFNITAASANYRVAGFTITYFTD